MGSWGECARLYGDYRFGRARTDHDLGYTRAKVFLHVDGDPVDSAELVGFKRVSTEKGLDGHVAENSYTT